MPESPGSSLRNVGEAELEMLMPQIMSVNCGGQVVESRSSWPSTTHLCLRVSIALAELSISSWQTFGMSRCNYLVNSCSEDRKNARMAFLARAEAWMPTPGGGLKQENEFSNYRRMESLTG